MASDPGPVLEFLGHVAYHFETMRPLFPTYLHLLVSAIFPIYTAAHASLSRPSSAAPQKAKANNGDTESEEDEAVQIESLTPSDAILFPVLAGGTLATLYFILKWLEDPAWLNWILGIYFSQIGLFFATKFLKDTFSIARSFFLPAQYSTAGRLWTADQEQQCFRAENGASADSPFPGLARRIPFPDFLLRRVWKARKHLYEKARLEFRIRGIINVKTPVEILDVASFILSCGIVYLHTFVAKPWYVTNFLGFSFCYGSLQYMTPTTAWTGTLLLSALFFYDIYFVFFTPMMVTVATKLDVPIKLLFPRPDGCVFPVGAPEGSPAMEEYLQCLAKKRTMAMLGLGDIVVPGMMLAFALRFDLYLHYLRRGEREQKQLVQDEGKETPKPKYLSATGRWGERFWTSSRLWSTEFRAKQFPKPYLHATIVGYLAGMVVTVVVMQVAQHAQPALLYLVPGVLLAFWGTAWIRGDIKALWNYSEMPPSESDKKTKPKPDENDKRIEPAESPSQIEGEKDESVAEVEPKSRQNDAKTTSDDTSEDDHQLVSFTITLLNPIRMKPKENGEALVASEKSGSTRATAEDAEDERGNSPDVVSDAGEPKIAGRERKENGEPPGKRARRV